jgi:penicillin-binding protein 2
VYDAQIVDKIIAADGRVVLEKEPVVANQINTDPYFFQLIMDGMEDVTSSEDGGTAGKYFKEKEYLKIAGKTGTSERTELDVENNAWMVCYAPYDNPQIVVVCYVQNGYSGAYVSQAIIDTVEYYLDDIASVENTASGIDFSIAD